MRCRCHHDLIRLGDGLQPRRQVRCLADYRGFLGSAFTHDVADNYRSGGDTDSNCQYRCVPFSNPGVQLGHRIHDREARPDGSFGIVLVCLWVSEVNEHAVTHVAGNEALVVLDGISAGVLKGRYDLAHILWIELRRECGRTDEIAEHDRQLAALGFAGGYR